LVKEEVFHILEATALAIMLVASITIISEHQLNEDGERPMEVLKCNKLCLVMDKFIALSSPNI
jgi:hypothetical protein